MNPFLSLRFVCVFVPYGHLLRKCRPIDSLLCDVLLCFCHFHIVCPLSGVVLDCIHF